MRLFPGDFRINKVQFDLDYVENIRYRDLMTFWNFYNGKHWAWARESGEPQTTVNYAKAIVDIGVDFLMGNSFSLGTNTDDNKEELIPILEEVWEENDRPNICSEMALVGGVTGDAWIEVTYDKFTKSVVLTVLDSMIVYPLWNPHNKDEMLQCTIRYQSWEKLASFEDGDDDLFYRPSGERSTVLRTYTYSKVYTAEKVREYHDDVLVNEYVNPVKMIPIAHIKNLPNIGSYGISDLRDVFTLNRELNEKLAEAGDIINYHSAPVTVIYGARAQTLERGVKKIWSGLPKDAKIENLQLDSDLPAINTHLEHIKNSMYDISSVPSHAFGDIQPVSNTSAVALQIMYNPIVRKTNKKRKTYSKGIRITNIIIMKYLEIFEGQNFSKLEKPYDTFAVFPDMLPKDESLEMQIQLEKINAKLTSREQALRDLYNWDDEKIQQVLQEADEDAQEQQKQMMENQYQMEMAMPHSNTETDTPGGAAQSAKRQSANGPDGKGRPKIGKPSSASAKK